MKKLVLCIALVTFSLISNTQSGKFNIGVNAGLPTGVLSEFYSLVSIVS